jgi:uridine kinase
MKEKLDSYRLIAISGVKGSGKNECSSMLQYCLSVPKIFRQYWFYKHFRKLIKPKYKILAFADPLKKMLSDLLNIPLKRFYDRDFKESCIIEIPTLKEQPFYSGT